MSADGVIRRYQYLDEQKDLAREVRLANPGTEFEAGLKLKAESLGGEAKLPWIYMNDVEEVWREKLSEAQLARSPMLGAKGAPAEVAVIA